MRCSRCNEDAVIYLRYNGTHLCSQHFVDFFEKRVYKEFRKQVDLGSGRKIAVAVSGGKDSLVALKLIHDILGSRRDSEVLGITIDEGISGYRSSSLDMAVEEYERLGIDYRIVSFEKYFDKTLDCMVEEGEKYPCSVCGVLRRWLMNTTAKDMDVELLATGLNLDDTAQSIMMNFCNGDVEKLSRLGPHKIVKKGLIPRIAPLRKIPENEVYLYALIKRMPLHREECPYAISALRGLYREVIGILEDQVPGTKFSILSSYDKLESTLKQRFQGQTPIGRCNNCDEPAMGDICKACMILDQR